MRALKSGMPFRRLAKNPFLNSSPCTHSQAADLILSSAYPAKGPHLKVIDFDNTDGYRTSQTLCSFCLKV